MAMEIWAVQYRDSHGVTRIAIFDKEKDARDFAYFPPKGVRIKSKPWQVC